MPRTVPSHATCHTVSCHMPRRLTPRATPSHAHHSHASELEKCCWKLLNHCGALHKLWKVYGPLWYLAVPYGALRCTAYMLRKTCGPLCCLVVCCGTVRIAETSSKGCGPSRRIAVCCICCGRLTDCYGTLRCLTMDCGALRKRCRRLADHCAVHCVSCRRLVDHCGALWCGVYIVEGLRTVMVPFAALCCHARCWKSNTSNRLVVYICYTLRVLTW